jgi:hypothetical protein
MDFFTNLLNFRKTSTDAATATTATSSDATTATNATSSEAETACASAAGGAEKAPDVPDAGASIEVPLRCKPPNANVLLEPPPPRCGPAQWTTINCHACGNHLGQGFNANCRCGRCPCPPMVPMRECPCRGRGIRAVPVFDVSSAAAAAKKTLQPAIRAERGVDVPRGVGSDAAHVRIGAAGRLAPAVDSAALYREGNFPALAVLFEELGYLAFSNFVPSHVLEGAAKRVLSVASVEEPPRDWEANLGVGTNWSPALDHFWKEVGSSAELVALREAEDIKRLISGLSASLGYDKVPTCLPLFTFARGKGPGAGTAPHVDFHGSCTADAGLDRSRPGFVAWAILSGGDIAGSSELCISPGSQHHEVEGPGDRLDIDGSCSKRDVLPVSLRDMLDNETLQWHILNATSGLNRNGTLVLLHPRVAHAATVSTTAAAGQDAADSPAGAMAMRHRVSFDARFASSAEVDT